MSKMIMLSTLFGVVVAAGTSGIATADNCKNVDIHMRNTFVHDGAPLQIKVVDFDYWDDTEGKWREELFTSTIINPGATFTINNRDLEFVGGESGVVVRVQFKYLTTSNGWSEQLEAESDPFTCSDGRSVSVNVE